MPVFSNRLFVFCQKDARNHECYGITTIGTQIKSWMCWISLNNKQGSKLNYSCTQEVSDIFYPNAPENRYCPQGPVHGAVSFPALTFYVRLQNHILQNTTKSIAEPIKKVCSESTLMTPYSHS